MQQTILDALQFVRTQNAELAEKILGRQCLHALDEKSTLVQKTRGDGNLKLRAARGRGMRNNPDERPVGVSVGKTYDQSRANLLGDTEVHQPDFAPFRHDPLPPRRGRGKTRLRATQNRRP